MVKLSSAGPRKIIRLDVYHRTITDLSEICLQEIEATCPQNLELCKAFRLVSNRLPKTYKSLSKRCPFAVSKPTCYFQMMNLYSVW